MEFESFGDLAKAFEGGLNAPILEGLEIDLECPQCQAPFKVAPKDFEAGRVVECKGCGAAIHLHETQDEE